MEHPLCRVLDANARRGYRARSPKALFSRALHCRRRTDADWLVLLFQVLELDSRSDALTARNASSTNGRKASSRNLPSSQVSNPARDNSSPLPSASSTYSPKNDGLIAPDAAALRKFS